MAVTAPYCFWLRGSIFLGIAFLSAEVYQSRHKDAYAGFVLSRSAWSIFKGQTSPSNSSLVNEEKSRKVDLVRGESFGFLGFEFRRVRSHRGRWMPLL